MTNSGGPTSNRRRERRPRQRNSLWRPVSSGWWWRLPAAQQASSLSERIKFHFPSRKKHLLILHAVSRAQGFGGAYEGRQAVSSRLGSGGCCAGLRSSGTLLVRGLEGRRMEAAAYPRGSAVQSSSPSWDLRLVRQTETDPDRCWVASFNRMSLLLCSLSTACP